MPYIKKLRRTDLAGGEIPQNAGELNYAITKQMIRLHNDPGVINQSVAQEEMRQTILSASNIYIQSRGLSYQSINDVMGAITCAAMEFSRRTGEYPDWLADAMVDVATEIYVKVAVPYEDEKIKQNGDVYV